MASMTLIRSMQDLADWFETIGYFSVTFENDIIVMTDDNENVIGEFGASSNQMNMDAYTSDGLSVRFGSPNKPTSQVPLIGIRCSGGSVLFTRVTNDIPNITQHLLISRNQKEDVVFAWHYNNAGADPYYYDTGYRAVSWNDASVGTYQTDIRIMHQTLLVPVCTRPKMGQSSYCENAFLMYCAQSMSIGQFILDGTPYYSTGWFAIKDN